MREVLMAAVAARGANVPNMRTFHLTSPEDLYMEKIRRFYHDESNMALFKNIIAGQTPISLRVLDWFVTNYSKKHVTIYDNLNIDGRLVKFFVYKDYKNQLKNFKKKWFDPFCRRERINILDHEGNRIETTIGQLNFFMWAIQKGVIRYVTENLASIDHDMKQSIGASNKKGVGGGERDKAEPVQRGRKKRTELSENLLKRVVKLNQKVRVKFE